MNMGKKHTIEAPATAKKRLEILCRHAPCAGQAHGTVSVECDAWEVAAYLLVHHFNHEGHKTEVRIDGVEYHRLAAAPAVSTVSSESQATTPSPQEPQPARFRWSAT